MSRSILYHAMSFYDQLWRRFHRVEKVDQLVSLSFEDYRGDRRKMLDGTWIEPGDCLAILHFNREFFTEESRTAQAGLRAALRFRRLLLQSLAHLADRIQADDRLRTIKALYGVTWFAPHGEKVGFMIERLPDNLRNRLRRLYFHLMLKVFFPAVTKRENDRLQPHAFWLTRQQWLNFFSEESRGDKFRYDPTRNRKSDEAEPHAGASESFVDCS